jgi:FAD dependent oxidoreductase
LPLAKRLLAESLARFLRATYPEYAAATGPFPAAEPGVRETFHWLGRYTLTAEDLISPCDCADPVAFATWPIELRESTHGPKFRFFEKPAPIPLRCLISAEIEGVFFAGRCLSATHEALASVRVMGTCFATGQAAGNAAAGYCRTASPGVGWIR